MTPLKKTQLAKSPHPVNHFRPTVCPSVTNLTVNMANNHGEKSSFALTHYIPQYSKIQHLSIMKLFNAMVTNHLRAPYGVSPKIVRFYGARTAPGRRQE